MASRLIKKKEQVKIQDKFMQLDREGNELKLKFTNNVKVSNLYQHLLNIKITKDDVSLNVYFVIYSNDYTPFTQSTLENYLKDKGYTSLNKGILSSSSVKIAKYINALLFFHNGTNRVVANIGVLEKIEDSFVYNSYLAAPATINSDTVFEL